MLLAMGGAPIVGSERRGDAGEPVGPAGLLDSGGGDAFDEEALQGEEQHDDGGTTTTAPARSRP